MTPDPVAAAAARVAELAAAAARLRSERDRLEAAHRLAHEAHVAAAAELAQAEQRLLHLARGARVEAEAKAPPPAATPVPTLEAPRANPADKRRR